MSVTDKSSASPASAPNPPASPTIVPDAATDGRTAMSALTAIRFLAALWVVLYHFRDQLRFNIDAITPVFANGPLGVDFFFILSGFVMAHVYADKVADGRFAYGPFLRKRLARLYPLHIATLAVLICLSLVMGMAGIAANSADKYDWSQLPLHLLLIHAWGFTDHLSWNIPSWSISAEFAAYLLFPLLALAQMRLHRFVGLALALLILALSWVVVALLLHRDLTTLQSFAIPRILPEFFLGIALWRVRPRRQPMLLAMIIVTTLLALHFSAPRVIIVTGLAALVWSASAFDAPRWLTLLGEASYSLYMIHALVQTVMFNAIDRLAPEPSPTMSGLWVLSVTGLCVLLSVVSYRYVEAPARQWLTGTAKPAGGGDRLT